MITAKLVDAIQVQFLKPIFEDDFPEKGMWAWLTDVEWDSDCKYYRLYFDFTDFEAVNEKYFKRCYNPNRHTAEIEAATDRRLFTAREAGYYDSKYSVYFSVGDAQHRNDAEFAEEIKKYLRAAEWC